jgi:hypothetical protein
MKKRFFTLAASVAFLVMVGSITLALAQQRNWTYKCPKCGLIQTYSMPQGVPKCPNDGTGMQLSR